MKTYEYYALVFITIPSKSTILISYSNCSSTSSVVEFFIHESICAGVIEKVGGFNSYEPPKKPIKFDARMHVQMRFFA